MKLYLARHILRKQQKLYICVVTVLSLHKINFTKVSLDTITLLHISMDCATLASIHRKCNLAWSDTNHTWVISKLSQSSDL